MHPAMQFWIPFMQVPQVVHGVLELHGIGGG
jgi:hypothetical protein